MIMSEVARAQGQLRPATNIVVAKMVHRRRERSEFKTPIDVPRCRRCASISNSQILWRIGVGRTFLGDADVDVILDGEDGTRCVLCFVFCVPCFEEESSERAATRVVSYLIFSISI
jgi:hypothetical protein